VVAHGDPPRHPFLHGAPVAVREAGRHVADPGRVDLRDAARADEQIEGDVADGSDEAEVTPPLADDLVRDREGDRGLEGASERDARAVGNVPADRAGEVGELCRYGRAEGDASNPTSST